MGRPYKCPFCGESRSIGKGYRSTKLLGRRKVRLCKACGRKFTPKFQKLGDEASSGTAGEHGLTA